MALVNYDEVPRNIYFVWALKALTTQGLSTSPNDELHAYTIRHWFS